MLPADSDLVPALLRGEEAAFASILDAWSGGLQRVARSYVRTNEIADEVVQDTWRAVIAGLPRFEGRSSLKTWIFTIAANRARTRAKREARAVPMSAVGGGGPDGGLDPDRLRGGGGWLVTDAPEGIDSPEAETIAWEASGVVEDALAAVPERQRTVLLLRDVEGLSSEDVCNLLEISHSNQRVLLHRGRAKLRSALATTCRRCRTRRSSHEPHQPADAVVRGGGRAIVGLARR